MLEGFHLEAMVAVGELDQVDRGEVAGRVVEEHVLRARIGGDDRPRRRAGVPVVDGGVELDAGIGRLPRGVADRLPQVAGLQRLERLAGNAAGQVPVAVVLDGAQELVGDAHRVVGVLAGDGEIGLRIPVGVVDRYVDVGVALLGELDDAQDVVLRHLGLLGGLDLALQRRVLGRIEAGIAGPVAIDAGLHDRLEVLGEDLRAGDQRGDLLLLAHLPVDVLLDVRVIDVDHHHLGGAARGAARLDGAGGAIADLEEAHQAGGLATAGELLAFAAQRREIGAGAGAVFEQARLAYPQVHDAALVDEVVGDRLDEAGVRLRVLIRALRGVHLAGLVVDIVVALAGAVDAVGPVQAGVEPLRRVGRRLLGGEHVAQLVEEGAGVLLGVEVAALPAPIGPGAGETVEDLPRIALRGAALALGYGLQRCLVGDRAPQPRGDVVLLELLQARRHAGLAEILLGDDVARHLAPRRGHLDVVQLEDDGAIRVADFTACRPELDTRIGRRICLGVAPFNPHVLAPIF